MPSKREKLAAIPKRKRDKPAPAGRNDRASGTPPAAPDLSHIVEGLRVLAVAVGDLKFDPANTMSHGEKNLDAIAGSLAVYGQRKPVVVNKRTGCIEAGNGTLQAALSLGWTHIAAVYVDDDPATAVGFSIADNRTAQLATWAKDALDKMLREVSTKNDARLDKMLADLATEQGIVPASAAAAEDPGPQLDRADELQKKWKVKPGDLFLIPSKTVPPRTVVTCPHCDCEQEV
jgi:hypothetical protein